MAIEGVVANLDKLPLDLPASKSALPAFGKLAVDFKVRFALKNELEERKDVIRNELYIHEILLQELTGGISHALKLGKDIKEQQLVIDPITSSLPLKDKIKWVSTRRNILYMPIMVDEILSASSAAKEMREAFEGLLSGEDSLGRINALISDIENILSIVDVINS